VAPPDAPAPSAEANAPPIPDAEIPSRADGVFDDLQRVESVLPATSRIQAIVAAEAPLRTELLESRAELGRIDPDRVSPRRLEDLRATWSTLRARLEDWMSVLDERWKAVQGEIADLQATTAQWQATRRDAEARGASADIVRRVDDVLARLAAVDAVAAKRSDALAALMDRVSQARETTVLTLNRLDAMTQRARRRLLVRDARPLWDVASSVSGADLRRDVGSAIEGWWAGLRRWGAEHHGTIYALAALLAAALVFAMGLRKRSRGWPASEPERDAARFLASRPIATGVLFALAVAGLTIERPVAPVRDVMGLLALAAVVRLARGFVPSAWRLPMYAIVALNVLDRLWPLAADGSLLQRLMQLLVTLPAAAGTGLWVRRRRRAAVPAGPGGRWATATTLVLTVASTTLAASLLALVLGWTRLSAYLTTGILAAAFAAFAWMVLRGAALALLPLVTRGVLGRALPSIRRHEAAFLRGVGTLVTWIAVIGWTADTLRRFQLLDPLLERASSVLSAAVSVGGLSLSAGRILAAVAILLGTWLAARALRLVLSEEVLPRLKLPAGADYSVLTLANYGILSLGVVSAAAAAGLSATQLTVVFGALGVGIGFGLQTIVNNFVSGLILIFERPIRVGDRVQTVDHYGLITQIGIRASTLRTFDGAEVVIPNGELIARDVINWTRSDQLRRVEVLVGVAYGTDPRQVLEILGRVAREHPRTLDDPQPQVFMVRFGDSSLDFRLLAWVQAGEFLEVTSDLHVGIDAALKEAGISIPFPQRDLHLRSVDDAAARAIEGRET